MNTLFRLDHALLWTARICFGLLLSYFLWNALRVGVILLSVYNLLARGHQDMIFAPLLAAVVPVAGLLIVCLCLFFPAKIVTRVLLILVAPVCVVIGLTAFGFTGIFWTVMSSVSILGLISVIWVVFRPVHPAVV